MEAGQVCLRHVAEAASPPGGGCGLPASRLELGGRESPHRGAHRWARQLATCTRRSSAATSSSDGSANCWRGPAGSSNSSWPPQRRCSPRGRSSRRGGRARPRSGRPSPGRRTSASARSRRRHSRSRRCRTAQRGRVEWPALPHARRPSGTVAAPWRPDNGGAAIASRAGAGPAADSSQALPGRVLIKGRTKLLCPALVPPGAQEYARR